MDLARDEKPAISLRLELMRVPGSLICFLVITVLSCIIVLCCWLLFFVLYYSAVHHNNTVIMMNGEWRR